MTQLLRTCVRTPQQTGEIGARLARCLLPGDVVVLRGGLGAGKTVFVRGMAEGLGCDPAEVQSPTFTLVRSYRGRLVLHHMDVYRLDRLESDLIEIGFEDFLDDPVAVTVIEWGDRVASLLPPRRVEVGVSGHGEEPRCITVEAVGMPHERVEALRDALAGLANPASEAERGVNPEPDVNLEPGSETRPGGSA